MEGNRMISTVLLGCSAALLSVAAIILGTYALRLRRENKSKRLSLGGVFLALGFLPMALVMFADLKRGSLPIFSYLTYFRNPFFMTDLTFDLFAQMGEISFLIDFFSTVTFTTIVIVSVVECTQFFSRKVIVSDAEEDRNAAKEAFDYVADRSATVPYISFCRFLS